MRRLRFCMVATFYPPYHFGGDAMYAHRLTEALAERGHEIDVVHSVDAYRLGHPAEPEVAFTHHPNVTLHRIESRWPAGPALAAHQLGRPVLYGRRLRAVLEGGCYDVIHYQNVSLLGAPGVLRLGRAVKLYTTNDYWLICPTHVLFKFDREACIDRQCLTCTVVYYKRPPQVWRYTGALARAIEHVDALLIPSRFALERHRAYGLTRPMAQLPYLVPAASPGPAPAEVDVPDRPFFLYVGRLEKLKGVQDLVRLFAGYREAVLLIAGDGTYAATLQRQARGLDHVRFLGAVHPAALAELYRRAVAVLVPSLCYETFGLPVAEAASHGTPSIVRRIGALAENVEEHGGGLVFDSLEDCRAAMERLRNEPELRNDLGRRGQAAFRRHWSTEAHLARYLGIVSSLLAGEGLPGEAPGAEITAPSPVFGT